MEILTSQKSITAISVHLTLLIFLANRCANDQGQSQTAFFSDKLHSFLYPSTEESTICEKIVFEIQYFASPKQIKILRNLNTQEEIYTYREAFWKALDPTSGTPENEFKIEHYQRLEYINSHYPDSRRMGSIRSRVGIYPLWFSR